MGTKEIDRAIEACENNIAATHRAMTLVAWLLKLRAVQQNTLLQKALEEIYQKLRFVYEQEKARRQSLSNQTNHHK